MPAVLVPHAEIPDLAARVTPEMLKVLRRIQQADFILNGDTLDRETAALLEQLTQLGLVDPGYEGDPSGPPSIWVGNANGSRVLAYRTGIRGGPHYEIPAKELAAWIEDQGAHRWWNVDGDPLLTGRLTFPSVAPTLAAELRKIGRHLLVQAKKDDTAAAGQLIGKEKLDAVTERFADNLHPIEGEEMPPWSQDRVLYLCWKGSIHEWLLAEDSETTELMRAEEKGRNSNGATGK
jgi:hypothetical protein